MRIKLYENFINHGGLGLGYKDLTKNSISLIKKIKSDVEDIFVELLDDGYLVDVKINLLDSTYKDYFRCDIIILKEEYDNLPPDAFNFIDIKEYVMMFESYIKEYGYCKLEYNVNNVNYLPSVVKDWDLEVVSYVKIGVWIKL